MKKLILLIGPSGSGKTTIRKKLLEKDPNLHVISPDDIRFKLFDYENTGIDFDAKREPEVWEIVYEKFYSKLGKSNILVDATNLTLKRRMPFVVPSKGKGYLVKYISITTPLEVCLKRNRERERTIDEKIIARQFISFQKPEPWEYDDYEEYYEKDEGRK